MLKVYPWLSRVWKGSCCMRVISALVIRLSIADLRVWKYKLVLYEAVVINWRLHFSLVWINMLV